MNQHAVWNSTQDFWGARSLKRRVFLPCVCFTFLTNTQKTIQVEKTADITEQTKRKASAVAAQAGAVTKAAKGIAESAKRQKEALGEAKALLPGAVAATDAALAALR